MSAAPSVGRSIRLALLGALLFVPHLARAADETQAIPPLAAVSGLESESGLESAMVEVDGRVLFPVRGVQVYPAPARAAEIAKRIATAAADPAVRPDGIATAEIDLGTAIKAGETVLVVVTDSDAELAGLGRDVAAKLYATRISQAIASYREDRQPARLLRRGLYVLGSTIVFLAALWLLGRLRRFAIAVLERRYKDRIRDVKIQSIQLFQQQQLWSLIRGLLRTLYLAAALLAFYVYASTSLGLLPWTRALGRDLLSLITGPLAAFATGFVAFIPSLAFLIVLTFVVRLVLRVLRLVAAGIESGTVTLAGFEPEWAWPTFRIVRALIVIFALVVAYPYIPGSGSMAFKGISLFLGVMFSLGSSSFIGNLLAGYSMTYRRAFRVGDRVQVEGTTGDVVETRLLVTHLRTPKNEEVVVPNALILNGSVVNYSSVARKEGLILHTEVGIGYETPWRQVEALLLQAAERTPGVEREPRPFVHLTRLGDFCVTYELNAYTRDPRRMAFTYAALHRSILDQFNEYGVQIMTPAYEGDPEQPKVVPRAQWFAAPARPTPEPPSGSSS